MPFSQRQERLPTIDPMKPSLWDYLREAFNARPIGMFFAPNWAMLGGFGWLVREARTGNSSQGGPDLSAWEAGRD